MASFLVAFLITVSGNLYCASLNCSSCLSGYSYKSTSCLSRCPSTFVLSDSNCIGKLSSNIFGLSFFNFLEFSSSCIQNFCHPYNLGFNDLQRLSPIPTIDRGFYFTNTSGLISNKNWIIAPDLTVRTVINIKQDGVIFTIRSSDAILFKLESENGVLGISYLLTNTITSEKKFITVYYTYPLGWFIFLVSIIQSPNYLQIKISDQTININDYEYREQYTNTIYYVGSNGGKASFIGFLNELYADNSVLNGWSGGNNYLIDCKYNEYYNITANQCAQCEGCQTWPWCISNTCNLCYSEDCSECTGYGYSSCVLCNNNKLAPDCILGKNCVDGNFIFNCSSCQDTYSLIDGLCINKPYLYDGSSASVPVLNAVFDVFQQYYGNLLQSGSNPHTYAPFNNPEPDDPYPLKNRGLYFNGLGAYLASNTNFTFNYKSSISTWIYAKNEKVLLYTSLLQIFPSEYLQVRLYSIKQSMIFCTYNKFFIGNQWVFMSFSIDFISAFTTIYSNINGNKAFVLSSEGYALYDSPNTLYIGIDPTNSSFTWSGFVYNLIIWQTAIPDFSAEYQNCNNGQVGSNCLWACDIGYYYNYYEVECLSCNSHCSLGCSTWGTCNLCLRPDCSYCSSFNGSCVADLSTSCLPGLVMSNKIDCCDPACADCYEAKPYQCTLCNSTSYLLGQICILKCPIGYLSFDNKCLINNNPYLTLGFGVIQDTIIDTSSGLEFHTGNDSRFYPNITIYDPIPAKQRGYYFTNTSYMKSDPVTISYNFTIEVYAKVKSNGNFLWKNQLGIIFGDSMLYIKIGPNIKLAFSGTIGNTWTLMVIRAWTNMDGLTTFTMSTELNSVSQNSISDFILYDSECPFILGDASNSFNGFIWSMKIYSTIETVNSFSFTVCKDSSVLCLWDCGIEEYYNGSSCEDCSSACTRGCVRESDCNLCGDTKCYECKDYASCSQCIANSSYHQQKCECDKGSYSVGSHCGLCPMDTGDYLDNPYNKCECYDYVLQGTCLPACPVGYTNASSGCIEKFTNTPYVRYVFDSINTVFTDSIQQLIAHPGPNSGLYPNINNLSPVPAYKRGVYFTGNNSHLIFPYASNNLLLGVNFYISMWFNPISPDGCLLSKQYQNISLFSIQLEGLKLGGSIKLNNTIYDQKFTKSLKKDEWNYILISLSYSSGTLISLTINNQISEIIYLSKYPYMDYANSLFYIGSTFSLTDFLNGFMYSLEIYTSFPGLSYVVSSSCDHCAICPASGVCLPSCNITSYSVSDLECSNCSYKCVYGCRNSYDCNLCKDTNCMACSSYESYSCVECFEGFEVHNFSCVPCNETSYYDTSIKSCRSCIGLCNSCVSRTVCLSCANQSHLNYLSKCVCDQGYSLVSNKCTRNKFNAILTVDSTNTAQIIFTEPLATNLRPSDIKVLVKGYEPSYCLSQVDVYSYRVSINFTQDVKSGDKLQVNFITQLVSVNNSLLGISSVSIQLFPQYMNNIISEINQVKSYTQLGVKAAVFAMIGISAVNMDFSSLFVFANCAEIYSYLVMYNIDLDPTLTGFLEILTLKGLLPSIFDYIIPTTIGVELEGKLNDFGLETNLFMLNSGMAIEIFGLAVILGIGLYALKDFKFLCIGAVAKYILPYYKYKFFFRYWVQTCLGVFYTALVGVCYTNLSNNIQIIDFILCIAVLVRFI